MNDSTSKESKANSIKEKFFAQKRAIEQLKARVTELEALLAGPPVAEVSIQSNFLLDQNILKLHFPVANKNAAENENIETQKNKNSIYDELIPSFSIEPEAQLKRDKIKELQILTTSLQEQLNNTVNMTEETGIKMKNENENYQKKISQLEGSNSGLQKEIDRLTASQIDYQSEIRKLKADISEKQNNIERLQKSHQQLTKNSTDIFALNKEKEELQQLLSQITTQKNKIEEQYNLAIQKNGQIETEKVQLELKLRKEIAEIRNQLQSSVEKEKAANQKNASNDQATKKAFQKIADCEATINSLQESNTKLTKENVKIMTELNQATVKIRELSLHNDNQSTLINQINSLRKENTSLRDVKIKLEQRCSDAEKRAEILSSDLQRMTESITSSLNGESVDDITFRMKAMQNELRSSKNEIADLKQKLQLSQSSTLKSEVNDLTKKNDEMSQSVSYYESKIDYVKQVVKQLLTAPFSQRQSIIELLVQILNYNAEDKDAIMKASAASSGKSLSSRFLYAFEPWV
ncbi:hypothetical protein M9Y10_044869 [Tritrichomonas musculus]|uniref:GRIP domain-containing protein n=1 Tax=Tritrichomonas musculus TaxID=1915356 RepID=A0ABR2JUS6_9EUKA